MMIFEVFSITRLARKLAAEKMQDKSALVFLIIGDALFIIFSFISSYIFGHCCPVK